MTASYKRESIRQAYVVLFLTHDFKHPCIWSTHSRDILSFHSIKCTVLWTHGTFALHSQVLFYSFMSANHHWRFYVTQLQVLNSKVCPSLMMRRWRCGNSGPTPNLVGRWVQESILHTTHIPYFNASPNESHTNNASSKKCLIHKQRSMLVMENLWYFSTHSLYSKHKLRCDVFPLRPQGFVCMYWVGGTIGCANWLWRCTWVSVGNNTPTIHLSGQRSSNSILCRLYSYKFVTYCILITSLLKQPLMSVGMHILWPEPYIIALSLY